MENVLAVIVILLLLFSPVIAFIIFCLAKITR